MLARPPVMMWCLQLTDTDASSFSDTVLPSTPESPGEMLVSPLGSADSVRRVGKMASPRLSGVSRLMKTPKQSGDRLKTQGARESPMMSGIKNLMKTPKVQKSPALEGLKKLVTTPKDVAVSPELDGIRKLVKTPKARKSVNLVGVRQLMKSPKAQKSPALDGLKKLVKTPKEAAGSPKLDGVRKLVKTPKVQKSPMLAGVKTLMRTPKSRKSPQLAGLKTLMKTPKQQKSPVLVGVKQLMKTPKLGPKSPDFVGLSEMLASPQAGGSEYLKGSRQKTVPKKKQDKEAAVVSGMPSPPVRGTRGRRLQKTLVEHVDVESDERLSTLSRGASGRKSSDGDEVVAVSRKVKLSKSGGEVADSLTGGKEVSVVVLARSPRGTAARKGRSHDRSQDASVTSTTTVPSLESAGAATSEDMPSSPHAARTRKKTSKSGKSEIIVDVSSSSETLAKSRRKPMKTSKETADDGIADQTPMRRKVIKTPKVSAAKTSTKTVSFVAAAKSPRRVRGGRVQSSESSTADGTQLILISDSEADDVGLKKPVQRKTARQGSMKTARPAGDKKSPVVRKLGSTVRAESPENVDVDDDVVLQSKGGRGAKKASAASSSENKVTRRGNQLVVKESLPAVENVKPQKGKESPIAATVGGGRRGKQRLIVHDESPPATEDHKVKSTPTRAQKRTRNTDKSQAGLSEQVEPVSAKSPVSTRKGKRQMVAKNIEKSPKNKERQIVHDEPQQTTEDHKTKSTPRGRKRARNVEKSPKNEENQAVAALTGKHRGKQDELEESVEYSKPKTPSRGRKRPQTTVDLVSEPVSKSRRQDAEDPLAVDQPMTAAKGKRQGKSSVSEPQEPVVQPDKSRKKTGAKSPVKKSGRGKGDKTVSIEVIDITSSASRKSDKRDSKLKDAGSSVKPKGRGKKNAAKVDVEIEKKAIISPPATRSKRARR